MKRRTKKVHKMRGYRRGYGSKKKHRGKGSKGGKGWGGSTKHNRSYVYSYARDHFGHTGFHPLGRKVMAINVGELQKLASNGTVHLAEFGYGRLLSRGTVAVSLTVHVAYCSPKAKEKIEKAGGKVVSAEVAAQ
ncbi:MAG: uL15 family ribosomal protein [Candidatus Aenigmarchaeota archaeon]|nr:uL15 family ribosomal protein [Candidatus Aenigmarchaeota archaeon]